MNTPVLSKKQQQKKLSAKKGLRNVLGQPSEKYWPVLDKDEESYLEELLNRLLPGLKRESNAIPWAHLRKMEVEERLATKKKARMVSQANANENCILRATTMGVNAVTRDLEKDKLSSVLLDSSVESLLVKHVVVMAQNKGIPILLVPFLKKSTLENIGFASAAMGFKSDAMKAGHYFNEVHQEIVKCSPPIPSAEKVLLNGSTKVTVQASTNDEKMSVEDENSLPITHFTLSTNVYKYRSTRNERAFVPLGTAKKVANDEECSDFIAIQNDDTETHVDKVPITRKKQRYMDFAFDSKDDESSPQGPKSQGTNKITTYLPLKVKRIQGNTNRLKATKTPKQKKKSSSNKG